MSRYSLDEPDLDRYEMKPPDAADVPKDGEPWGASVDPAEHAAHALIDALMTLELQMVQVTSLERAVSLKHAIRRLYQQMDRVDLKASEKIDELMERRR